eukprot:TRINITY_DN8434_c0_g1_i2.p2 TRINITY_DN8434_c0_g1~~TRINITY_DN8434_c0_g1_i2.p2  ORF type:complete len:228 (+),score=-6.65 TRINITY_DN8434_c0_g1_i2:45-686(+)
MSFGISVKSLVGLMLSKNYTKQFIFFRVGKEQYLIGGLGTVLFQYFQLENILLLTQEHGQGLRIGLGMRGRDRFIYQRYVLQQLFSTVFTRLRPPLRKFVIFKILEIRLLSVQVGRQMGWAPKRANTVVYKILSNIYGLMFIKYAFQYFFVSVEVICLGFTIQTVIVSYLFKLIEYQFQIRFSFCVNFCLQVNGFIRNALRRFGCTSTFDGGH